MIVVYRKSDRLVVANSGTNSLYPGGIPGNEIENDMRRDAAKNYGGVRGDYDTYRINDNDTKAIKGILNSPTTFVSLTPGGKPVGIETYDAIVINKVYYYYHDLSAEDDPPDGCVWSRRHFNTRSAVEYFIELPNNKLDSEVVFTIEPENKLNLDIPITLTERNRAVLFGPDGKCGSTNKPVARVAFTFDLPGAYDVQIWTKWHGSVTDRIVVRPYDEDEFFSTKGPEQDKPWQVELRMGQVWKPHKSDPQKNLQNVVGVRRVALDDNEKLIKRIEELERHIEDQNKVIGAHEEVLGHMRALWFDFYNGQDAPF